MFKRIATITFIYICTTVAWLILASTIFVRSESSAAASEGKVSASWGAAQEQWPPQASYEHIRKRTKTVVTNGVEVETTKDETVVVPLPLEGSKIDTALELEPRQKGLL
jgi:hypothetical protein